MNMKILTEKQYSFKGYDARPLKGFFMSSNLNNLAGEIREIGEKEGFKIYSKITKDSKVLCSETIPELIHFSSNEFWAQDVWSFLTKKMLSASNEKEDKCISKFFNINKMQQQKHLSGGNFFIVNNNGKDELIVGESALETFSTKKLKEIFDVEKICILPQMDFHLDLFIRPLDDKKILVTDDNLTLEILEKGKNLFKKFISEQNKDTDITAICILKNFIQLINSFKASVFKNKLPQTDEITKILNNYGYKPIRVPGRIYTTKVLDNETFLSHDCNYINAVCVKNPDKDIVYITNKSNIDTLLGLGSLFTENFSFRFENEFKKMLEPHVKSEKIYFVDGENKFVSDRMLKEMQGGIHCICSEIPLNIGK